MMKSRANEDETFQKMNKRSCRGILKLVGRTLKITFLPLKASCYCTLESLKQVSVSHCIGLMLAASTKRFLITLYSVSDRTLNARFPARMGKISILQCCASTETSGTKEAEAATNSNDFATVNRIKKELVGSHQTLNGPVGDVKGGLLIHCGKHLKRWREHFGTILNRSMKVQFLFAMQLNGLKK